MHLMVTRFLIAIAFSLLMAHGLIPHHHHHEVEILNTHAHHYDLDQNHQDHDDHNIFTYGHIDDNFRTSQNYFDSKKVEMPLFIVVFHTAFSTKESFSFFKIDAEFVPDSSPPNYFSDSFSHRGPPIS